MKKGAVPAGLLLFLAGALALAFSPDAFSLFIVLLMCILLALGFFFTILPLLFYSEGLRTGRAGVEALAEVSAAAPWDAMQQQGIAFHQKTLDALFAFYRSKTARQQKQGVILSGIDEVINEEALALRSWQHLSSQIPGTMTALGLLGTFLGLILGIRNITFSSVDATVASIQTVLWGIDLAFYTSIVGVIFSILFNLLCKLIWSLLVRELHLFLESFQMHVLPSAAEQARLRRHTETQQILERLNRLPKKQGYLPGAVPPLPELQTRLRTLPLLREGLKNGEFLFYIQPVCDLNTRAVVGGEALIRWNHGESGLVTPESFLPAAESSGLIVKLDQNLWESVCRVIRQWLDDGKRPLPLSVNLSRTDLMALDLARHFRELVRRYRIPPRYLELEVSESVWLSCPEAARETGAALREAGFRLVMDGVQEEFPGAVSPNDPGIDALKLDLRYFEGRPRWEEALESLLDRARKAHLPVMAAGIENAQQLTLLRRGGCTLGQGFHLHRPMPPEEFGERMEL